MKMVIHRTVLALFLLTATSALAADFDKGLRAYNKGDYKTALQEWNPLAEQGDADAQRNLGSMYFIGRGVPKDVVQAASWIRKAAEQGDAIAQGELGFMYFTGQGVPKDVVQAASWIRKAAEQGLADAQVGLGVMYDNDDNGWGVPKDDRQAAFWGRKAAEQGNAHAQGGLGLMYYTGRGVPKDYVQAYAWFNLAAAQGDEDVEKRANEERNNIRQHMTSSQIAEAQKLSREIAARIERNQSGSDSSSFADTSDSVFKPEPEMKGNGSGFVIGRNRQTTFIVTNHHVVEDCAKVTVVYAGKSYEASVLAKDANSDLALLETNIPNAQPASFSRLSRARLGEAVTAAGYPLQGLLSKSLNVTGGNISALAGLGDDAKHLQITAPLQPGNSGGPLLDASGNVVGVAASKLNAIAAAELTDDLPQNVNFAIKAALVRSFLDIHGVDYQRLPSETKLEPEQLAEHARQFTVAVHCWK